MNSFKEGDKFYWTGAKDIILVVDKVDGIFVLSISGGCYLYTECVKMENNYV